MKDKQADIRQRFNISTFVNLKLNFWGIPKCGNTTVKHRLLSADNPVKAAKHEAKHKGETNSHGNPHQGWVHAVCHYITPTEAGQNGFKNFMVLRDPIPRVASMYANFALRPERALKSGSNKFKNQMQGLITKKGVPTLLEFLHLINKFTDNERNIHYRSQHSYWLRNDIILINLDDVSSSIRQVHPSLSINEQLNKSTCHLNYDKRTEDLIYQIFREDFDLFRKCVKEHT